MYVEAIRKNNDDYNTINLFNEIDIDMEDPRIIKLFSDAKRISGISEDRILNIDFNISLPQIIFIIEYHSI